MNSDGNDCSSLKPVLTSIFRGQSHDIKVLKIVSPQMLLSGGETTDICIYKLEDGRFRE